MQTEESKCLYCERSSQEIPLVTFEYQGKALRICSQHLPVLIHNPGQLIGKIPGAESFSPADH